MKTLKLTVNKKWFDLIEKGIKTEEYREIKQYWLKRLTGKYVVNVCEGIKASDASAYSTISHNLDIIRKSSQWQPMKFDIVEFTNGYSPKSPKIIFKCLGIHYGKGNTDWGAVLDTTYFVIKLGLEVGRQNC